MALKMSDWCLLLPLLPPPAARRRPGVEAGSAASLTWMQAPLFSLHRQQIRAHLLLGIWDTLVMGSIFSGLPMLTCTNGKDFVFKLTHESRKEVGLRAKRALSQNRQRAIVLLGRSHQHQPSSSLLTSGIHKAQLTWTHLVPLRVGFMAPPFLGHNWHFGRMPRAQIRQSQLPFGTF